MIAKPLDPLTYTETPLDRAGLLRTDAAAIQALLTGGTARIVRVSGPGPFLAYAVGNDGAGPGQGTGDGAWVRMQVPAPAAR